MRVVPYFLTPEDISGIIITFVAIDQLKKAQMDLVDEQDKTARIIDTSPLGITVVDTNNTITFANRHAENIFRLIKQVGDHNAYADPTWKIISDSGSLYPDHQQPFNKVMQTGEPCYGVEHAIETFAAAWLSDLIHQSKSSQAPAFFNTDTVEDTMPYGVYPVPISGKSLRLPGIAISSFLISHRSDTL
jgi:hypothetical protein